MGRSWTDRIEIGIFIAAHAVLVLLLLSHGTDLDVTWIEEPYRDLEVAAAETIVPYSGLQTLYAVMSVGLGLVGTTLIRRGLPAFARANALRAHDPSPVNDLHLESGTVKIEGVAEPLEGAGTVAAPYSGTECLAYRYEYKERRRRVGRERDRWRTVESGSRARPFTVADDTGTVTVAPGEATLTFGRDVVVNSGRLTETEWRLEPGETVSVSGQKLDAVEVPDVPATTSTVIGGDGQFVVSDASERRTILRILAKGTVRSLAGAATLAGAAYLVYGFIVV